MRNSNPTQEQGRVVAAALLLIIMLPLLLRAEKPDHGALYTTVLGIRPEQKGVLIVALYDRPNAWLQLDSAKAIQRIPILSDSTVVIFDTLSYDSNYAVAVIHDRNGNDKLDMRWFPIPKPKEGSGVSQNHTRKGKPDYFKARFSVGRSSEYIRIQMRY